MEKEIILTKEEIELLKTIKDYTRVNVTRITFT
jgi:hypothetical protein